MDHQAPLKASDDHAWSFFFTRTWKFQVAAGGRYLLLKLATVLNEPAELLSYCVSLILIFVHLCREIIYEKPVDPFMLLPSDSWTTRCTKQVQDKHAHVEMILD